jgi:hypothetical protein
MWRRRFWCRDRAADSPERATDQATGEGAVSTAGQPADGSARTGAKQAAAHRALAGIIGVGTRGD